MQSLVYDAVIVGAGPAGASCAVWLSQLGFSPIVIEASSQVGGLVANNPFNDVWNVTAPNLTGAEVANNIKLSLEASRVPVLFNMRVQDVQPVTQADMIDAICAEAAYPSVNRLYRVAFGQTHKLYTPFLVIATGVSPRSTPEIEVASQADVLVGPGAKITQYEFAAKRVAVLGGGDNSFENALYIRKMGANQVHIYARHIRAQRRWLSFFSENELFVGDYSFDPHTKQVNDQSYDVVAVMYGWQARLSGLESLGLALNADHYIQVDPKTMQTNIEGVYAVGEVCNRLHPCVVSSLADGVSAAKAIQARLESLHLKLSERSSLF